MAKALADPTVLAVVLVTPAQSAKTEFIFNVIGWAFCDVLVPLIYVGPSRKLARSVMRSRLEPFLESVPEIADMLDRRRGWQSVEEKYIAGIRLGLAWAGSSKELKSHPCGIVLVDELDEMRDDIQGAGDPLLLGQARTKNYRRGVAAAFSTPTIEGASPIWDWWERGSMERWHVECAHCGEYFWPALERLRWTKDSTPAEARQNARLACPECGGCHDEAQRVAMPGRFIPSRKIGEGQYEALPDVTPINPIRSFHVNWAASRLTPMADVAFLLREAYLSKDPTDIQTVTNQQGGEIYRVRGEAPPWERVKECATAELPRLQLVTAGVDVQKDGLWLLVRGWCHPNATSYRLAWTKLHGDPTYDSVWTALNHALAQRYAGLPIALTFVDSGYRPGDRWMTPEHKVYEHCLRHPRTRPTKGRDVLAGGEKQKAANIEYTPEGSRTPAGIQLWHINTHYWKEWTYGRINAKGEGPGGWHVPIEVEDDYCKQVTNEQIVYLASGGWRWIRTGDRANHALDCECLAAAAADVMNVQYLPPPPDPSRPKRPPPPEPDPSLERQEL